jgi:acetate kinase
MGGEILTLNCGSSSIKFAVFSRDLSPLLCGEVESIGAGMAPALKAPPGFPVPPAAMRGHGAILDWLLGQGLGDRALSAVGHRVVHGGDHFVEPVTIGAGVRARIEALSPLAPLHQPHNVAGIDAVARAMPGVPQIACFDTAFHATIPEPRRRMPLPARFDAMGLRRYGFHGLSYEGVVAALPALIGERANGKVVACHLGNGASVAAIAGGRSQYTSMGFTPLDGLLMGSRPGRLDPGAVLWLTRKVGIDEAERVLNRESGLLGVSGISSDMRTLLKSDEPAASLAVDMFVDRLVQEIAAAAAVIGGIEALVFTGGIGERSAEIRERSAAALGFLGVRLDEDLNRRHAPTISPGTSPVSVHVVSADEEGAIARAAWRMLHRDTTFV